MADQRKGCSCLSVVGGVLLLLVGCPMLVLPGPGIAAMAAGAALIAAGLGFRRSGGAPETPYVGKRPR